MLENIYLFKGLHFLILMDSFVAKFCLLVTIRIACFTIFFSDPCFFVGMFFYQLFIITRVDTNVLESLQL